MIWKPNVTVAAVIEQDGKFLLVEEETDEGPMFNQPAGHWERGETLVEGVIREATDYYSFAKQKEREFKFDLVGEAQARRLEVALGAAIGARLQVNRFFDTPARDLRRARWALRLRGEWRVAPEAPPVAAPPPRPPDRVILSVKGARRGTGAFHDRLEEQAFLAPEEWVAPGLAVTPPPGWADVLPPLTGPLAEILRFTNLRRAFPVAGRWRAEIDRTLFADGRRAWELELEIGSQDDPGDAEAALARLCSAAGIGLRPQEKSKLERALEQD